MSDELNFVLENYEDIINEVLEVKSDSSIFNDIAVSFFANNEEYIDSIEPITEAQLRYGARDVLIYQDFSIEKTLLTDCNICMIEGMKFLKIITPFTRSRSYDFLIAKAKEMPLILKELQLRSEKANFHSFASPVIGLDFEALKKDTIDFLLNENFRDFCKSKNIPLKRGLVIEGAPGVGKSLSLRWLKEQALSNKISFTSFKSPKQFFEEVDEYYRSEKKIFVFEDFDTLLREREDTDNSPNVILGRILNTLDGVDEIQDVVSIFTTNKVSLFDSAFLRPGRIDKVYHYKLPTLVQMRQFFRVYVPEQEKHVSEMITYLNSQMANISYAILKGICDDINIYIFNKGSICYSNIEAIMKEKLAGSLKGAEAKSEKDYVL